MLRETVSLGKGLQAHAWSTGPKQLNLEHRAQGGGGWAGSESWHHPRPGHAESARCGGSTFPRFKGQWTQRKPTSTGASDKDHCSRQLPEGAVPAPTTSRMALKNVLHFLPVEKRNIRVRLCAENVCAVSGGESQPEEQRRDRGGGRREGKQREKSCSLLGPQTPTFHTPSPGAAAATSQLGGLAAAQWAPKARPHSSHVGWARSREGKAGRRDVLRGEWPCSSRKQKSPAGSSPGLPGRGRLSMPQTPSAVFPFFPSLS